MSVDHSEGIARLFESLRCRIAAAEMVPRLQAEGLDAELPVVHEVLLAEHEDRAARQVERLRKASKLPIGKRFETFDLNRLPPKLARTLRDTTSAGFRVSSSG